MKQCLIEGVTNSLRGNTFEEEWEVVQICLLFVLRFDYFDESGGDEVRSNVLDKLLDVRTIDAEGN
jgi:hypothetical protein